LFYQDFLNSIIDVVIGASVYLQGYFILFLFLFFFYFFTNYKEEREERKKIKKENNTELTPKPNNDIIHTFGKILTR
jgi:uncharacterized membrane protein